MTVENFKKASLPMPELNDGEVLLKATLISVDPYMRGMMDVPRGKSYFVAPFALDESPSGGVGSTVVASRNPDFKEGDVVQGYHPWQRYFKSNGEGLQKCDISAAPLEKHMSSLMYSGMSAYLPIVHIAVPKPGETAFVSGAAGAVGSMACQILKKFGCKVVGSAGSAEKVAFVEQLGVKCFNYKAGAIADSLAQFCPDGIDIYFDNVGGEMLEAVLTQMNDFGRIIACGMISQYDKQPEDRYGVKNLFLVVSKRLKMQGFIMGDWQKQPEVYAEAKKALQDMVTAGEVQTTETILEGFDRVPEALLGLFRGNNLGKMLVRCDN